MTKTNLHISLFILLFFGSMLLSSKINAQCQVKIVVPRQQTCLNDTISMYALGGCGSVLVQHFNDSTLGNQLSSNHSLAIARLCDNGIDGSIYPWFGSLNNGPHILETSPLNLNFGGFQICFDMRYGEEGAGGMCEGPSSLAEAVHLQYSTNAGGNWTDIQVWNPNGGHDPNLIQWQHYCVNLPAAAQSTNTLIRWSQNSASAINTANWGIDNINIIRVLGTIYTWSSGYSGAQHPDIHPSVNTFYSVTASGTNGCVCTDSITIYPSPKPSANYIFTGSLCKNEDIIFNYSGNAPSGASYNWSFNSASKVNGSGQGPIIVQWPKTGSFYPTLSVSNKGCSSNLYKTEVRITPLISFYMDKSFGCEPLTINYIGNAFPKTSDYFWDFGDGGTSTDSTPSYTYVNAGDFDLTLILRSNSGCYDTLILPKFARCYPSPNLDFTFSPSIIPFSNPKASFNNQTQNGSTYLWDFGDGGSSVQTNPLHTYTALGDYQVMLKAESDKGCTDSLIKVLKVVEDRFSTPNVITPNGDGVNDVFKVENLASLQSCTLGIYNRWGQLVYSNENYDNLWDGDQLADGVYFYIVKYVSFFGEGEFQGTLTIMRK